MYQWNVLLVQRHGRGAFSDCVSQNTLRVEWPLSKDQSRQAVVAKVYLFINSKVRLYKSCKELAIVTKSLGLYAETLLVAQLAWVFAKSFIKQQIHWSTCAAAAYYAFYDGRVTLPKKNPSFENLKIQETLLHFNWLTWSPEKKLHELSLKSV